MAAVSCVLSEDQFLCCICLEVFTDPVSTSCGHSFCKTCINNHWDHSDQYQCPVCKEHFSTRPQLKTNTFMSEMVSQLKNTSQEEPHSEISNKAGEVLCDVCSESRLKALKSCLVCLASYCQTHLEPHLNIARLKRHQLISPVKNLEERICSEHDKPLELFCKTDMKFICLQCSSEEHKSHDAVPLKEECETRKTELKQIIKQRQQKIIKIQESVELSQKNADQEMAEGIRVFTALMESVQKSLDQFKERITEKQKNFEERAADLIKELEEEVCVLEQRRAQVEQALVSEDHFSFLQTLTSVNPAPELENWTDETVCPLLYDGLVAKAVSELEQILQPEMKKVSEAELKQLQQFAVDVTLDLETAHPKLVLSSDNKQVYHNDVWMNLPDVPQRFSTSFCILGKQKFSSGKFYFQVQVKGKTDWVLGVARESVKRKVKVIVTPQNGYWTIRLTNGNEYKANGDSLIPLSPKSRPETVGVFVDYDEGLVSFYDVDTADLLYSFTKCCFLQNILPFFGPQPNIGGKNPAPLILTSVQMNKK